MSDVSVEQFSGSIAESTFDQKVEAFIQLKLFTDPKLKLFSNDSICLISFGIEPVRT